MCSRGHVSRRRRLLLRDAVNVAAAEHNVARGHGNDAARGEDGLQLSKRGRGHEDMLEMFLRFVVRKDRKTQTRAQHANTQL